MITGTFEGNNLKFKCEKELRKQNGKIIFKFEGKIINDNFDG